MRILAGSAIVLLLVAFFARDGYAHKPITSKFMYNEDVYPVFLNRCGGCHIAEGVGPMSLLSYDESHPWAEALRVELLELDGPQPEAFIREAHRDLSARDLDIILDWSTGGTPEGDPTHRPTPSIFKNEWPRGLPDAVLQIPDAFHLAAERMEDTGEFVVQIKEWSGREVLAIDLRPGTPAIVRDAEIRERAGASPARLVAAWTPRQAPKALELDPPLRLAKDSELIVRLHYKKTWKYEAKSMTDRSAVGLYFKGQD